MKLRSWRWGWAVAALVAGSQIWAWSQTIETLPRQALLSARAIEAEPFDAANEVVTNQSEARGQVASQASASQASASQTSASRAATKPESAPVGAAEATPGEPSADQHAVAASPTNSKSNDRAKDAPKSTTIVQAQETVAESIGEPVSSSVSGLPSDVAVVASTDMAERPQVRLALRQAADRGGKVVAAEPLDPQPQDTGETRPAANQPAPDAIYDGVPTNFQPLAKNAKQMITRAATAAKLPQADFAAKHFDGLAPLSTDAARSAQAPPRLTGPTAGDFCHRPLYFQEINLERYGSSWGFLQPAVSGARFFATVPALPYLMAVDNPNECYDWSYPYPAGFPAPRVRELPPLSVKGGLLEAGALTGLIFLIP